MNDINPQLLFWRQLSVLGSTMGSEQDFQEFVHFVKTYKLQPVVDSVFAFEDIPLGFLRMKEGSQFGKIVFDHT
jgi:D-arabinose 1-dehydrogenase-like Zn-dependent alcohol dehydrogenase